jgi:hypothetical protein
MFKMSPDQPSLDTISTELVRKFGDELRAESNDREWTRVVKKALYDVGKDVGHFVCCHGSGDQGEWMLDLIWMDPKSWALILAVESEWGRLAAIEEDFGKLMCVKAPQKLMLFATKGHQASADIVSKLERNMTAFPYHIEGEEYLLMEITAPGAYRYFFRTPTSGTLSSVKFAPMEVNPLPWQWETATVPLTT